MSAALRVSPSSSGTRGQREARPRDLEGIVGRLAAAPPPGSFSAVQVARFDVSRLEEALLVSFRAMGLRNLKTGLRIVRSRVTSTAAAELSSLGGAFRRRGLSHGPRPEELAKRASRRTFQRALERLSRRDACGVAPQDEVGAEGGAHLGSCDRPENSPQGIEMLDFTPGYFAQRGAAARADPPQAQHPAFAPRAAEQRLPALTIARKTRRKALKCLISRPGFPLSGEAAARAEPPEDRHPAVAPRAVEQGLPAPTIARKICCKALKCLISRPGFPLSGEGAARADPPQAQHPAFAPRAAEQRLPALTIARKTRRKALKCLISRPGFPLSGEAAARAEPPEDRHPAVAPRAVEQGLPAPTIARKICCKALKCLISRPGFPLSGEGAARADPPQAQHPAFAPRAAEQGLPASTIARKICCKALKCLISRPGFPRRREVAARAEPPQAQHPAFAPRAAEQGLPAPTIARKTRRKALKCLISRPGLPLGGEVAARAEPPQDQPSAFAPRARAAGTAGARRSPEKSAAKP